MIRPLDQHFLGTSNVRMNIVHHYYLRGDVSITDDEECWSANLRQTMPGSRLGRNLKLPGILNLDMEVVHCNLRDPFSVRWCLVRRPCDYVHFEGVRCSTLSDRVFLRLHLRVKLLPLLLLFRTRGLVPTHSGRDQY